ncbi:calcium ATPase [Pilatotrama ljubarskyi]|nr:calcium ATPase [Pilatotrama ljubarskyi]
MSDSSPSHKVGMSNVRPSGVSLSPDHGVQVQQTGATNAADPASAIRRVDVHRLSVNDVYTSFSTSPTLGLEADAVVRRAKAGKNVISSPPTQSWKKAANYVFGGFNLLMWIAFIVTILSYEPLGAPNSAALNLGVAVLLLLVIIVSATFYALVDWHASPENASVFRDGKHQTILARDLVVGDLGTLSMGDRVPADLRLVQVSSDNALETRNLALTSTFVVQGTCTGVVFTIGDRSVMGRTVAMSTTNKLKLTTVQREIWFFTKIISTIALGLFCLRRSYPGFETASQAIINSIGCLTASVPLGLPVCVALMAKRNALITNLATIETLGCMSVLCSDKTGTLTVGKMSVQNVAFLDAEFRVEDLKERPSSEVAPIVSPSLKALHMVARLCNSAKFDSATAHLPAEERTVKGDATDTAMLRFAEDLHFPSLDIGSDALLESYEKFFEIPFNSKNKWMLSAVRKRVSGAEWMPESWMVVKGAPDVLLQKCTSPMKADGVEVPMSASVRFAISGLQDRWSGEGQRGIETDISANELEELMHGQLRDLTLVGLVGIRDPPKVDVLEAVRTIHRAGVRIFMVTGDFKLTALAIARQVSIVTQEKVDRLEDMRSSATAKPFLTLILTGDDIETLQEADWDMVPGNYTELVFARTTPEQKLRSGDNTVAVTGDGVNDAPALKASDIGVVMGSGSDVAKEAAAMILLNNDFASIVVAIEMGRLVFDNLKKVIIYLVPAGSYTEFVTVFCNTFLGMEAAMSLYLQVCFSITNDVVMSISLTYEQAEADLMLRKSRNARTDRLTNWQFFFIGLTIWLCAMGMWFLYMKQQGLGFYDVLLVYNKRTDGFKGYSLDNYPTSPQPARLVRSNPLWGPRRNLVVPVGMTATALIAVVNLYGPGLQDAFDTRPIPRIFWGIPFGFALGLLTMDEIRKLLVRTYPNSILARMAW